MDLETEKSDPVPPSSAPRSNLEDVLVAIDLSRVTFRRIRWNYLWAFGYNCLMIPVCAIAPCLA